MNRPTEQEAIAAAEQAMQRGDPLEALRLARIARNRINDSFRGNYLLGAAEIDVGMFLSKPPIIKRGIKRLEAIEEAAPRPTRDGMAYNIGNGYLALGGLERGHSPGSRPSLTKAVNYLDESLALAEQAETRTNLANALVAQGRWIEALDHYEIVLTKNPDFHQALAMRGSALMGVANWSRTHRGLLIGALNDHVRAAELAVAEPLYRAGYMKVVRYLVKSFEPYHPTPKPPTKIQRWIRTRRLGLSVCPICCVESPDAYDVFPLSGPLRATRRRPALDEVIEMMNAICRTFASGRLALLCGTSSVLPAAAGETIFVDTDIPARHDLAAGLVMSSVTQFYSVFQQIAFSLNRFLHLGHKDNRVTFDRVWWQKADRQQNPPLRHDLHARLRRTSNPALSALYQLALSMAVGGGKYFSLRNLRNQLEHHLVIATNEPHESRYFHCHLAEEIEEKAVQIGQLARAAIWYFAGTVLHFEAQRDARASRGGRTAVLIPGNPTERM